MQHEIQAISQIQATQKRFAVTIGVSMGVIMSLYFFSFATLIDRGMLAALLFEIVTTLGFIVVYFLLNRISFALTRARYQNKAPHAELLTRLSAQDVNTSPEALLEAIHQSP